MDYGIVESLFSILTLVPIVWMFMYASLRSPLGTFSLPSMTMITSFVYFFAMPLVALATGDPGYFGMFISHVQWMHAAVLLYVLGACAAFLRFDRVLNVDPSLHHPWDKSINKYIFRILWSVAIIGVIVQAALGKLNLTGDENYVLDKERISELAFITQAFNMMVPLTLVLMIRERFSPRSFVVLAIVILVFLQVGFRFRILMLLAGVGCAFVLEYGIKVRIVRGVAAAAGGILLSNLMGAVRNYGKGIDLGGLTDKRVDAMSSNFGGEFGIVYVLDYSAGNPLPSLVWFEPWVVAIARMVPSFLWQDKPYPTYFAHFIAGATQRYADKAGIAAPQHVEMLLQFGWPGVLPLAFIYFSFACWLVRRVAYTGRETRIAGAALIPFYFGYYMQTRGYFFQIFADGLFILGPLFLLTLDSKLAVPNRAAAPAPERQGAQAQGMRSVNVDTRSTTRNQR
jgi:hypothetical protein